MPPGPYLDPISQEIWDSIPDQAQQIISDNGLEWERFYDRVEARIALHDDALNQ